MVWEVLTKTFFKKWHLKYDVYHVIRKCQPIFPVSEKSKHNYFKYVCKMAFKNRHLKKLIELNNYRIRKKSFVVSWGLSKGYSVSWKVDWIAVPTLQAFLVLETYMAFAIWFCISCYYMSVCYPVPLISDLTKCLASDRRIWAEVTVGHVLWQSLKRHCILPLALSGLHDHLDKGMPQLSSAPSVWVQAWDTQSINQT